MIVNLDFSNLTESTRILIEDKLESLVMESIEIDLENGLIDAEDKKLQIFNRVNQLRKKCKIYLELDEKETVDNSI